MFIERHGWLAGLATVSLAVAMPASAQQRAALGPATFASVLAPGAGVKQASVARYELDREPVTNAEFLAFVQAHPEWRRDRAPRLFAEPTYLSQWEGPATLGARARPEQPVTQVSWYAARAYCQSQGARLPTWYEWEYAAAADETRIDARAIRHGRNASSAGIRGRRRATYPTSGARRRTFTAFATCTDSSGNGSRITPP
jgi:formylglycine-generating enzyme required for sulfatase activity